MSQIHRIAVIGGGSAVGRQILRSLPPAHAAIGFVRRQPRRGCTKITDYIDIAADDLAGFQTVINCAGLTSGTRDGLFRANALLPQHLAEMCKRAGIKRFVHLSSFSVFGSQQRIDDLTSCNPVSVYGQSKCDGDTAILAAASRDLIVRIVRLPSIISAVRPKGKIASLVRFAAISHLLPIPYSHPQRSIVTNRQAAMALVAQLGAESSEIVLAADPLPFTFEAALQILNKAKENKIRPLPFPKAVNIALNVVRPEWAVSLFGDSMLASAANLLAGYSSEWKREIAAIARGNS